MIMKIKFSTGKEIELSSEEYEELRTSIKQNLYGANKCSDCEYAPKIYNGTYPIGADETGNYMGLAFDEYNP